MKAQIKPDGTMVIPSDDRALLAQMAAMIATPLIVMDVSNPQLGSATIAQDSVCLARLILSLIDDDVGKAS